eukprot:Phypoly_transcript_09579.p1 GENE.Phypoly_transcript_09579~~Phypoly_transcript_09579.p1  ORF type:complete len:443 (+),score=53.76 Phypoly_transcript_09579:1-1329(+)
MFGGETGNNGCPGNINNAASDAHYYAFSQNLVNHAQSLVFDGIDLDWESCIDFTALTRVAQTIRQLWPTVFLTFPTGVLSVQDSGDPEDPSNYVDLVQYLDAVNMMSYSPPDNWGGWDGPWHVSPLTGDTPNHPYSISLALNTMVAKGIPRNKIGIGMAFYGSCWGSPITQPVQNLGGNYLKADDNTMSYGNIASSYSPYMQQNWDSTAQVPYLNSNTQVGPAGCTYISYDNDESIQAKAEFVNEQGLAGLIIWTVGEGIQSDGSNPALNSVYNYFGRSYTAPGSNVIVYADSVEGGFASGSWADSSSDINLDNTNVVHSGSASASLIPADYSAIYFYQDNFIDPSIHDGVEFYINGGSSGGQDIMFDVTLIGPDGDSNRVDGFSKLLSDVIPGGIPQNSWARGYISFSGLPAGKYDGFWWMDNSGGTQGELYIDDVKILFK